MKNIYPFLFFALSPVVPAFVQQSPLPFEFTIRPVFSGSSGSIECYVDTTRFPRFFAFSCHEENGYYVYHTCRQYTPSGGGRLFLKLSIPSSLTQHGTFTIEFGICQNDPRTMASQDYSIRIAKTLSVAERYEDRVIDGNMSLFPNRRTIVHDYHSPDLDVEIQDYYDLSGMGEPSLNTRRMGFCDLLFRYGCSSKNMSTRINPKAELRLLDHLSDFPGLGEVVGDAYRVVPIVLEEVNHTDYQTHYRFRLDRDYYYSLKDYSLISAGDKTFASDCLFIPTRLGHDTDTYRYQILLSDCSASNDSFRIEGSTSLTRNFFGPFSSAEYSVTIGGENDA